MYFMKRAEFVEVDKVQTGIYLSFSFQCETSVMRLSLQSPRKYTLYTLLSLFFHLFQEELQQKEK